MPAPKDFSPGTYDCMNGDTVFVDAVATGGVQFHFTRGVHNYIHRFTPGTIAGAVEAGRVRVLVEEIMGYADRKLAQLECGARPTGHRFVAPPPVCVDCHKPAFSPASAGARACRRARGHAP